MVSGPVIDVYIVKTNIRHDADGWNAREKLVSGGEGARDLCALHREHRRQRAHHEGLGADWVDELLPVVAGGARWIEHHQRRARDDARARERVEDARKGVRPAVAAREVRDGDLPGAATRPREPCIGRAINVGARAAVQRTGTCGRGQDDLVRRDERLRRERRKVCAAGPADGERVSGVVELRQRCHGRVAVDAGSWPRSVGQRLGAAHARSRHREGPRVESGLIGELRRDIWTADREASRHGHRRATGRERHWRRKEHGVDVEVGHRARHGLRDDDEPQWRPGSNAAVGSRSTAIAPVPAWSCVWPRGAARGRRRAGAARAAAFERDAEQTKSDEPSGNSGAGGASDLEHECLLGGVIGRSPGACGRHISVHSVNINLGKASAVEFAFRASRCDEIERHLKGRTRRKTMR